MFVVSVGLIVCFLATARKVACRLLMGPWSSCWSDAVAPDAYHDMVTFRKQVPIRWYSGLLGVAAMERLPGAAPPPPPDFLRCCRRIAAVQRDGSGKLCDADEGGRGNSSSPVILEPRSLHVESARHLAAAVRSIAIVSERRWSRKECHGRFGRLVDW